MKKHNTALSKVALSIGLIFSAASLNIVWAQEKGSDEPENAQAAGDVEIIQVRGIRESLQRSLSIKKQETGVVDAIVAEDMGKFPGTNIADSLQRIAGVYLSRDGASNEGQRISIRGLGPQYAVTTINGAPVHTTSSTNVGGSTRDFNYDVFPSDLFGQVNIYKTPMAELTEGGIGGVVDLQTPRPFDNSEQQIRYSVMASHNTASEQTNPRMSFLYSNTWGNVGALFGVAYSESINTRSGYQSTGGFNTDALSAENLGPFVFALDLDDPRANLGEYTQEQIENAYVPRFHRAYAAENKRERQAGVISLQYQNDRLDVSLDSILSELTDHRDEHTFGLAIRNSGINSAPGMVPLDVFIDENNNLNGTFANAPFYSETYIYDSETKFRNVNLRARYFLTDTITIKGQITSSKSEAEYSPNRIFITADNATARYDLSQNPIYPSLTSERDFTNPQSFMDPTIAYELNNEMDEDIAYKLSADWLYDVGSWYGKLSVGFTAVESTKALTRRNGTTIGNTQQLSNGLTFESWNDADLLDQMLPYMPIDPYAPDAGEGFPRNWASFSSDFFANVLDPRSANLASPIDASNSFGATESVNSYYIQSQLTGDVLGRELRILAGLRFSDTDVDIFNYGQEIIDDEIIYVPNTATGSYNNLLPSISLAYSLQENLILRASWGKTITRAGLNLIASNIRFPNIFEPDATAGNPNLRPQQSDQWDVGGEWYFADGGMISLGAFWKKLTDTTRATRSIVPFSSLGLPDTALGQNNIDPLTGRIPPDLPINLSTYFNSGEENLSGLEFAYQQNFTFLPAPFDGLGLLTSYTRVKTDGQQWIANDGEAFEVWTVPKYGYTITSFYEKGPLSLRLSYSYKDRTIHEPENRGADLQRWNAGQGYLDATFGYEFTEALELKVDALNLTDELTYEYFSNPQGRFGDGYSRLDNALYSGTTIMVGLRGAF